MTHTSKLRELEEWIELLKFEENFGHYKRVNVSYKSLVDKIHSLLSEEEEESGDKFKMLAAKRKFFVEFASNETKTCILTEDVLLLMDEYAIQQTSELKKLVEVRDTEIRSQLNHIILLSKEIGKLNKDNKRLSTECNDWYKLVEKQKYDIEELQERYLNQIEVSKELKQEVELPSDKVCEDRLNALSLQGDMRSSYRAGMKWMREEIRKKLNNK